MNRIRIYLCILIITLCGTSNAQINLVPNPSFEVYDTCPSVYELPYRGIDHAIPWFQPCTSINSTDYLNPCAPDTAQSPSAPNNDEGFQIAHSGTSYAGFIPGLQNNNREYLEIQLTDTLYGGKKYCVSFFISRGNQSAFAVDGFGGYFSRNGVFQGSLTVLNRQPQVENASGNIIADTLNWVEIYGEFYANGGEKFITIGNFMNDVNTNSTYYPFGISQYAYYYIDDISVTLCDSTVGINENEITNFEIYPNPAKDKISISISNITTFPKEINFYELDGRLAKQLKCNSTSSKTEVDINDLKAGLYFVEILSDKEKFLFRKKLMVQK